MKDFAFDLLRPELIQATGTTLWIADENALQPELGIAPRTNIIVISNRIDLTDTLSEQGWQCRFTDFDFSGYPDGSIDTLIYRISKEKPIVHHVINQAIRLLKPGGQLFIAGLKNEGIKTYLDKAKKRFDGQLQTAKSDKNTWMGILTRPDDCDTELLDDQDYAQLREIASDANYAYSSKPGVFGWNKIDKGSEFLIEQLPLFMERLKQLPNRVLDLGCGYGYLAMNCASDDCFVTATDNNATALQACQDNFTQHNINGEVIPANCAEGISERYPMVICNPPFHQGFSVVGDLTDIFLRATRRRLENDGIAAFVVNLHIPLERKASAHFDRVETIADNGSFKLVLLAKPKR
ncbi:methyltransferase [Aliamphritea spongicola]|uniref:methyltransferase n=1 Tax=Aliamphritea spongicola TaxID=707589 RepID=UPI00196A8E2F|nr:methyltransferase [Aliamphritea spongicola]MBN3564888.1 class I SAM-dependent methyltransferase [Aliamphritea spongicola]